MSLHPTGTESAQTVRKFSSEVLQLLYLTHRVPFPPNRGDRIRSFHWLRYLSARAHVHLACLADEPVDAESRARLAELTASSMIVPLVGVGRWMRGALSMARGKTATEGLFRSPELTGYVRQLARTTKFDAVLAFCSSMWQYADVPELADVPRYVDLVDVDSQKWFDYAALARGPKQWLYRREGRRLRVLEQSLAERSEGVMLVSRAEENVFRRFAPKARTHAVENGVDVSYFRPGAGGSELGTEAAAIADHCVFVGALDYRANIDGLTWFCDEVWPKLRRRRPQATLAIVGRNPAAAVTRLADLAGVTVAGSVPDVRPWLSQASVVVAPLRIARGVQNKVLEALAMERAVVASPQALEGLEIVPGTQAIAAETPEQWVDAVAMLLENRKERERLGMAGRAFAVGRHGWEACLSPLDDILGLSRISSADSAA